MRERGAGARVVNRNGHLAVRRARIVSQRGLRPNNAAAYTKEVLERPDDNIEVVIVADDNSERSISIVVGTASGATKDPVSFHYCGGPPPPHKALLPHP